MIYLLNNAIIFPLLISLIVGMTVFCISYYFLKMINNKNKLIVNDIEKIAGDNVCSTKLDLARAYLEIGEPSLAKECILKVLKNGDPHQQQEAANLLKAIQ